ncbi:all-trans-retinol 13,14-reductase [Aureococcus anophagefferens]|nr:all-trans-retinol 13,14-reductase [Aureococcus anophagefferens]
MAAVALAPPTLAEEVSSFNAAETSINEAKTAPVATPRQILPKVQFSPAPAQPAAKSVSSPSASATDAPRAKKLVEEAVVKRKPLAAINGTNRDAPRRVRRRRHARTRVAAARARATPLYKLADTLLVNADTVIATPSITPAAAPSGDLPPFSDTGSDPYDSASSAGTPRALVWDSPHLVWRWARAPGSAARANAGKKKRRAPRARRARGPRDDRGAADGGADHAGEGAPLAAPAPVPRRSSRRSARRRGRRGAKAGPLRRLLAPARKLLARLRADRSSSGCSRSSLLARGRDLEPAKLRDADARGSPSPPRARPDDADARSPSDPTRPLRLTELAAARRRRRRPRRDEPVPKPERMMRPHQMGLLIYTAALASTLAFTAPSRRVARRQALKAAADETYDVVVIGSGIGGLSCAGLLAAAGKRVCVLESHYEFGGCAHEYAAGPLYSLSPDASPNPLKHIYQMVGEEPEWITYDKWGAYLPEAPEGYELSIGAENFLEILRRYGGPTAVADWERLASTLRPLAKGVMGLPSTAVRGDLGLLATLGLKYPGPLLAVLKDSSTILAPFDMESPDSPFRVDDPFLRNYLDLIAFLLQGLPAKGTLTAVMAYMVEDFYREGAVMDFPVGGSKGLIDALVRGVTKREGCDARRSTRVEKVVVEGGRAVGVETRKGRIFATEAVVSNADLKNTFDLVDRGVSEAFDEERDRLLKDVPLCKGAGNEPYEPWAAFETASGRNDSPEYRAFKEQRAQPVFDAIAGAPAASRRPSSTQIASPLTHARYLNRHRGNYGPAIAAGATWSSQGSMPPKKKASVTKAAVPITAMFSKKPKKDAAPSPAPAAACDENKKPSPEPRAPTPTARDYSEALGSDDDDDDEEERCVADAGRASKPPRAGPKKRPARQKPAASSDDDDFVATGRASDDDASSDDDDGGGGGESSESGGIFETKKKAKKPAAKRAAPRKKKAVDPAMVVDSDTVAAPVELSAEEKELKWPIKPVPPAFKPKAAPAADDDDEEASPSTSKKRKSKSSTGSAFDVMMKSEDALPQKEGGGGEVLRGPRQRPARHQPPHDIFADIVRRFPRSASSPSPWTGRSASRRCAPHGAPILAMDLTSQACEAQHGSPFPVEHIFSSEVEPFKQAYIQRNFAPPLLFRDVRELGNKRAHTAFGALEDVPQDRDHFDVLIAGTSCVDYSNLNDHKKTLDQGGESGQTFYGMRTRTRGYLLAVAHERCGPGVLDAWEEKLAKMRRAASASLEAFMLAPDDRASPGADLKHVSRNKNDVPWEKCEARPRVRGEEKLGQKRPVTNWAGP